MHSVFFKIATIFFLFSFNYLTEASDFNIACNPSLKVPFSIKMEPVPMVGLSLQCPTGTEKLNIAFSISYGSTRSSGSDKKNNLLFSDITLKYDILNYKYSSFLFMISLTNLALKLDKSGLAKNASIIASWENEFGTSLGAEFLYRFSKFFFLSIPITSVIIFSSPNYMYFISTGLSLGYNLNNIKR